MKNVREILIGTNTRLLDISMLLIRLTVGLILFMAGAGKVFGWFGGQGMELTIQSFVTQMHIPAPLAYLSCYTELIGGLLLIIGLLTRPAAVAVTINMLVATVVTVPMGFLKVAAFPFSLLVCSVVILLAGPLAYSLDVLLLRGRAASSVTYPPL